MVGDRGLFQALKSRLVAGVIGWLWPYFAGVDEVGSFCPPIYPPTLVLRKVLLRQPSTFLV